MSSNEYSVLLCCQLSRAISFAFMEDLNLSVTDSENMQHLNVYYHTISSWEVKICPSCEVEVLRSSCRSLIHENEKFKIFFIFIKPD